MQHLKNALSRPKGIPARAACLGVVLALAAGCAGAPASSSVPEASAPAPASSAGPAASVAASSSAPAAPEPEGVRYLEDGGLELPTVGATGFTLIDTALWPQPTEDAAGGEAAETADTWLPPGAAFAVEEELEGWWRVAGDGFSGWVQSDLCMVNLPDVIPSIVYDDTNAYASVFLTCGKAIPDITGLALYEALLPNARLGRDEYVMPVLYPMARRICAAQQAALAEGNTLVIVEAFRPWAAQKAVVQAVTALAAEDEEVNTAVTAPPWGVDWFIATGVSNHQQGYAVDLTIARVNATEEARCGPYAYTRVTEYTRYDMQTPIHELSPASAAMAGPLSPRSEAWRDMAPAPGMNDNAFTLQRYCTDAGLTPLASEWWHFNDYAALAPEIAAGGTGNFTVNACLSFQPQAAQ